MTFRRRSLVLLAPLLLGGALGCAQLESDNSQRAGPRHHDWWPERGRRRPDDHADRHDQPRHRHQLHLHQRQPIHRHRRRRRRRHRRRARPDQRDGDGRPDEGDRQHADRGGDRSLAGPVLSGLDDVPALGQHRAGVQPLEHAGEHPGRVRPLPQPPGVHRLSRRRRQRAVRGRPAGADRLGGRLPDLPQLGREHPDPGDVSVRRDRQRARRRGALHDLPSGTLLGADGRRCDQPRRRRPTTTRSARRSASRTSTTRRPPPRSTAGGRRAATSTPVRATTSASATSTARTPASPATTPTRPRSISPPAPPATRASTDLAGAQQIRMESSIGIDYDGDGNVSGGISDEVSGLFKKLGSGHRHLRCRAPDAHLLRRRQLSLLVRRHRRRRRRRLLGGRGDGQQRLHRLDRAPACAPPTTTRWSTTTPAPSPTTPSTSSSCSTTRSPTSTPRSPPRST